MQGSTGRAGCPPGLLAGVGQHEPGYRRGKAALASPKPPAEPLINASGVRYHQKQGGKASNLGLYNCSRPPGPRIQEDMYPASTSSRLGEEVQVTASNRESFPFFY